MTVLSEEILKSMHGTEEKAIQPTWVLTVAGTGSVSVKMVESEGSDYPNCPCVHLFLQPDTRRMFPHTMHISFHGSVHTAGYLVPCSPSCSPPPLAISRPSLSRLEIKALFFRLQRIGFWQLKPI